MVDKDGIARPDSLDRHMLEIKNETRKVEFDGSYSYRPRNIFFRMCSGFFRSLAIMVFNPFIVLKYKMFTFGGKRQKALKGKPFIITCNHVHMFDDLSIGTNLFCWRKIYFTTLSRNIKRPMIGTFLRLLGGIPIPERSLSGTKKFNEDISYLLSKNKPVIYNPEVALWPYYRDVRPFKRGAFLMAVRNNVPVLPIAIMFKRKKKRNGKYKYKLYFAECKPIEIDYSLPDERSRSEKMMNQTYEVISRVVKEWYEIQNCGYGDHKYDRELIPGKTLRFEDDHWIVVEDYKKKKSK